MRTNLTEHNQHYAPGAHAVGAALTARPGDAAPPTRAELAALDQFHTGGLEFTRALAEHATITAADHVLDVGGGLGGPARFLAQEAGCQVTVLELTEAYCRLGEQLTSLAHLTHQVRFQQGDALAMPFADASYDVVWTQHSTMNIPDKARLYSHIHRVLRPGGRLAFQEVVAGSGEPLHLPTMWAHAETMNFVVSPDALRATVTATGLREQAWYDITADTLAWLEARQGVMHAPASISPLPGLPLLLGADGSSMLRNHLRNLQEGRIRIIEGHFVRR